MHMVHLEEVSSKNIEEVLNLSVAEPQKEFVTDNRTSLEELDNTCKANGQGFAFGVYDDDRPVGFVMIGYDTDEAWENPPAIAKGNYSLWRLMIDRKEQQKGYGSQALKLAMDFIRTFPFKKAQYCWTSYDPHNIIAKRLYLSYGFEETKDMDQDEVIAVCRL